MIARIPYLWALLVAIALALPAHANTEPPIPDEQAVPIALLVDITSGQVLYARNADRRFVPASITKVMTLYHAFELMAEGTLAPTQIMTMREETWEAWNGEGSTMWIGAGDQVPVSDLLTGIANISANDASVMLAEGQAGSVRAWTDGMNARARMLEMTQSHFATPNGWPDEGETFTTATDLVKLAEALLRRHPGQYARYVGKPGFQYNGINQRNHDPLIGQTSGADGIKTGYTNESGHGYLGSAEREGQRLVLVVAGIERYRDRRDSARNLMDWGFGAFDRRRLVSRGQTVGTARVQGGSTRSVGLRTDRDVYVNVPKGRSSELQISIAYDGPLRAPFVAGENVATLVIDVPGMEPAMVPLLAAESVDEAGFVTRILNGIAGWLS